MGGDTEFGGSEVVTVMVRMPEAAPKYEYRLLATTKTSTMQKEIQAAGDAGFEYWGQTVFNSAFGGQEVVVILERDRKLYPAVRYPLLATSKTATMAKELREAGEFGFRIRRHDRGQDRDGWKRSCRDYEAGEALRASRRHQVVR